MSGHTAVHRGTPGPFKHGQAGKTELSFGVVVRKRGLPSRAPPSALYRFVQLSQIVALLLKSEGSGSGTDSPNVDGKALVVYRKLAWIGGHREGPTQPLAWASIGCVVDVIVVLSIPFFDNVLTNQEMIMADLHIAGVGARTSER